MQRRRSTVLLLLLMALVIAACQKAEEKPTPTPDQMSIEAASTLFAQPATVTEPAATTPASNDVEIELNRVAAYLENAVLSGDLDAFLSYVWQDDPVFTADITAWAADWVAHPLEYFHIDLFNIVARETGTAEARMTIRWRVQGRTGAGSAGGATISAQFFQDGTRWLFAGPHWATAELDGVTLYYFATDAIDNTAQARVVLEYLPSIFTGVTVEFDHVPERTAHIQLYESPVTLRNWTRVSMPDITRWNMPGESIKIPLTVNNTAPDEPIVGRELTRFVLYDMAGGVRDNYPWWMEEGIAEYGGLRFSTLSQRNRVLKGIVALALAPENAEEQLFEWADLESEPIDLLAEFEQIAIQQAYTLIHYITETYGKDTRNAWIGAVAGGQSIADATQEHLGVSFDDLDAAWRDWLRNQT